MDAISSNHLSWSIVPSSKVEDVSDFKTIQESFFHFSKTIPNQDAAVFVTADGDRESVTYKQLYDKSVSAARGFIKLGVKPHEIVAVNVRNCPEWLFINFGIIFAGAIVANISFTYTDGSDVKTMMEKLGTCSKMVLDAEVDDDNWKIFRNLIDEHAIDGSVKSSAMPYLRSLVMLNRPANTPNLKTVTDTIDDNTANVELPILNEDDVVSLFQTSGSTGVPKLVAHTHISLIEYGKAVNRNRYVGPFVRAIEFNDRPFAWMGGWPLPLLTGITLVTRCRMGNEPENNIAFIFDVIKREWCNAMSVLPPMLHAMLERQADTVGGWPYILTGGQLISKDLIQRACCICKEINNGYGGTEFGSVSAVRVKAADEYEEYSCGTLHPGVEVKVVDENEKIVPVGMTGEIYVRSKGLFKEYWNDPEKTAAVLTPDGWYKTDDIGHLSEKGVLFVEGRKSDMIISGGMNVSPAILEKAIKTCPDVHNVLVVPISHPVLYQVVCACVIPMAGSNVTEEELRRHCESIHNDKPRLFTVLPEYYLIMETFPETKTGKTSRKDLAKMAEKLVQELES